MSSSETGGRTRLKELCSQRLAPRRIILASNRGPVEYHLTKDGKLHISRGSGGVVTALGNISKYIELHWIASAMGEGDRRVAREAGGSGFKLPDAGENLYLHFIISPRSTYHKFYSIFCNPLLWFLQHYMWNSPRTPNIDRSVYDAWENGYIPVNQAFAQTIIDEATGAEPTPIVMLHDYHLYLTGAYIRNQMPELIIQHFIHIPWPSPSYWQLLPDSMRQAIHRSLCTMDIVGFQTERDVLNFLYCS